MKKFLKLKLAVLVLLVSMGMLTNADYSIGQPVSKAYEQDEAPEKPENLQAVPLYYSLVKLNWTDKSNNEDGFRVYKKDKYRDHYSILFDVPANKTSAYVWDLSGETEYFFYVEAFNQHGNSMASNIVKTTTPEYYIHGTPNPPTNLQILFQGNGEVEIGWNDNSNNEMGFKIARKINGEPFFEIIDSVQSDVLTYREVGLEPDNIISYKVCAYNEYGFSAYTNTIILNNGDNSGNNEQLTNRYLLKDNYPNPFNPSTIIEFSLAGSSNVRLTVYNALGEEVKVLSNTFLKAGNYLYEWNGSELSSGVYFYKLETDDFAQVKKMILIK